MPGVRNKKLTVMLSAWLMRDLQTLAKRRDTGMSELVRGLIRTEAEKQHARDTAQKAQGLT